MPPLAPVIIGIVSPTYMDHGPMLACSGAEPTMGPALPEISIFCSILAEYCRILGVRAGSVAAPMAPEHDISVASTDGSKRLQIDAATSAPQPAQGSKLRARRQISAFCSIPATSRGMQGSPR